MNISETALDWVNRLGIVFNRAIGSLEGDQRLRDWFVSAGIFLFIM
jgi:hypothetical protein